MTDRRGRVGIIFLSRINIPESMIRVNDAELPFIDGETIGSLLSRAGSLHPFMVVSLNGEFLRREQWGDIKVKDGDIVRTVEMIAGG